MQQTTKTRKIRLLPLMAVTAMGTIVTIATTACQTMTNTNTAEVSQDAVQKIEQGIEQQEVTFDKPALQQEVTNLGIDMGRDIDNPLLPENTHPATASELSKYTWQLQSATTAKGEPLLPLSELIGDSEQPTLSFALKSTDKTSTTDEHKGVHLAIYPFALLNSITINGYLNEGKVETVGHALQTMMGGTLVEYEGQLTSSINGSQFYIENDIDENEIDNKTRTLTTQSQNQPRMMQVTDKGDVLIWQARKPLSDVLKRHNWKLKNAVDKNNQPLTELLAFKDKAYLSTSEMATGKQSLHFGLGCNGMEASYNLDVNSLLDVNTLNVGYVVSTEMACQHTPELTFASLMTGKSQLSVTGNTLTQVTADGSTLTWQGTLTSEAKYGEGETIFLEVAPQTEACADGVTQQCLKVRDVYYDDNWIKSGYSDWRLMKNPIEGYSHDSQTRQILRINKYITDPVDVKGKQLLYVLDMVVETEMANANANNNKEQYANTIRYGDFLADVRSQANGDGSYTLSIQPAGESVIKQQIDAPVIGADAGDINHDGYYEVVVFTQSVGSGSYGGIVAYSSNNGKSWSEVYYPELSAELSKGYMGHDEFALIENVLVRRFPIYLEGDTNAQPTGKMRQIQYHLKDGEASRKFVVDRVIEF